MCDTYQCGVYHNADYNFVIDCGNCEKHKGYTCGDNGIHGICGNECAPIEDVFCSSKSFYFNQEISINCRYLPKYFSEDNCVNIEDEDNKVKHKCCFYNPPAKSEDGNVERY